MLECETLVLLLLEEVGNRVSSKNVTSPNTQKQSIFSNVVEQFGMIQSVSDHSTFCHHSATGCIYLCMLDDVVIKGSDRRGIAKIKHLCHHLQTRSWQALILQILSFSLALGKPPHFQNMPFQSKCPTTSYLYSHFTVNRASYFLVFLTLFQSVAEIYICFSLIIAMVVIRYFSLLWSSKVEL